MEWRFSQVFGEGRPQVDEVVDADIVSTLEFDESGDYLAAGDRGGRIILFEREKGKKQRIEYKFLTEFQSHEAEFDYLKSLEIEEKINKIEWLKKNKGDHFLLSTNDKTIKLWKIYPKKIQEVKQLNKDKKQLSVNSDLVLPKSDTREVVLTAIPKKIFGNAHAYHINSISVNSDYETFISSDDLRINLWNLEVNDQSFNILDIKPANMEELTEVITSSEFHPHHCNLFIYSTSKGTIKIADMRASALCDSHAKVYEESEVPHKSFFSEIISSISDVKFSRDGRYVIARDYMSLKIWDINMEKKPIRNIHVHDYLQNKLCDLYENDCIFDKFECSTSYDASYIVTGSYQNQFYIYERQTKNEVRLEASKDFITKMLKPIKLKPQKKEDQFPTGPLDFNQKILHSAWHPTENTIAIGASNNMFIFTAT